MITVYKNMILAPGRSSIFTGGTPAANPAYLSLNGTDEYFVNSYNPAGALTAFGISFWIKCSATITSTTKIMDLGTGNWISLTGHPAVASLRGRPQYEGTGGYILQSDSRIDDGAWHHVVLTHDANDNGLTSFYVDGVKVNSAYLSYTNSLNPPVNLAIGYFNTVPPAYNLKGILDEVAIYNKALTAEEVSDHYNGGNGKNYCVG